MNDNMTIKYTKEFVSIDTFNEAGKFKILEYVKSELDRETSAKTEIHVSKEGTPILISYLKTQNPKHTLMLEGHLDVVSPEEMVIEPFKAAVDGEYLIGRGTCDMKAGCAAMMSAYIHAAKSQNRISDIYLVFSTDEEYSGAQILEAMEKKLIPNCTFTMIAEPTNNVLCTAHKGNAWIDVEFFGKASHASVPELGINAAYMACDFVCEFKKYTDNLYNTQEHEIYGKPTMNVGVVNAGIQPNTVPANAFVRLDKRYLPGDSIDSFINEIEHVFDICKNKNSQFNAKYNIVVDCYSVVVDRANPDFLEIKAAISETMDKEVELGVVPFWGEGGYINKFGVPVVYYGPGKAEDAHTKDEKCKISDILNAEKGYMQVVKNLCIAK